MERLTMWYDGNHAICANEECSLSDCPFADPICEQVQNIIDRLAAYENTDLEPDEIKVLQEYHDLHTADDAEASRRLIELARADREGRCVVLPKDRMVYFHEESIDSGEKWVGNWPIKDVLLKCGFGIAALTYSIQDVGSKIYFNREEAEAVLRRKQDG